MNRSIPSGGVFPGEMRCLPSKMPMMEAQAKIIVGSFQDQSSSILDLYVPKSQIARRKGKSLNLPVTGWLF
jgi:hypothetical protein